MAPAPVEDIDLDNELLEIIGAGRRRISNSNEQLRENTSSQYCEKPTTIKKPLNRPGPLSKKRKLESSECQATEKVKAPNDETALVSSCDKIKTKDKTHHKSSNSIPKSPSPAPKKGTTTGTTATDSFTTNAARPPPGPLSKKPKLQAPTKPTSVSLPPPSPIPSLKNKEKSANDKVTNSDNDDTKTEIVEFERAVPLNSAPTNKPIQASHKSDDKPVKKPKLCTRPRPGPLSKKIGLATNLIKNTQENCTDKSKLPTSNDCVTAKIKVKPKSKVQIKGKVRELDNSASIKSEQAKQSSSSPASESSVKLVSHDEALILQQFKWKEGIRKLQDEIGAPVSMEIIMDMLPTKDLMTIQNLLDANKCTYLFELVLPHIWMDLNLKDLLQCRVACKRWNQAVDNLLENHPFRGGKSEDTENDFRTNRPKSAFSRHPFTDRYYKQCSQFELISLEKVTSFLAKTRNHSRNPFVTKSVLVRLSMDLEEEELSTFLDGITELFQLHGKHIWYLHLDIQGYHSVDKTFKIIHRVLKNVQNLKSFKLMCHSKDKNLSDEQNEQIAHKSLPNLCYLESLDLSDVKLPVNLIGILIKKYDTSLVKLHFSLYRWKESYSHKIVNLRELSITAMCSQDNLGDLYFQLRNLMHLQRLTKISLVVMVTLNTKCLFGILQQFKGLRTVKLIILEHMGNTLHFENSFGDNDDDGQLKLPQVNSLELSLTSAQNSLSFLKYFPNLQNLHFTLEREFMYTLRVLGGVSPVSVDDRILRSIKKCILYNSATKSRLWALLPKLQVLTVHSGSDDRSKNELCFVRDLF